MARAYFKQVVVDSVLLAEIRPHGSVWLDLESVLM